MPWKWIKGDYYGLVYFVTRESKSFVPLNINVLDLIQQDQINQVVEEIYEFLRTQGLQYALEPVPSSVDSSRASPLQHIRKPAEIIGSNPKEGTCLDLALFFCGVCLGYDLLPVLILLEEHAVVAVSSKFDLRRWERRRSKERFLFDDVLVKENQVEDLKNLLASGSYLTIECTGFARCQSLHPTFPEGFGRESNGDMSFRRAINAGLEHFRGTDEISINRSGKRKFLQAIDYGTSYRFLGIDPLSDVDEGRPSRHKTPSGPSPELELELDPLPYLLNRNKPEMELRKALLAHRLFARQRPLVCLIHGDEFECHEDFINRIHKSLPKILGFWDPEKAEEPILRWPMELSFAQLTDEKWEDVFWGDLAAGITGTRETPRDTIINRISRHKVAVMIEVPVLSEQMKGIPLSRLDLFLQFWNQWQNVSQDLLLIVCLSLKYQKRFEGSWKTGWRSLNNKLRRYVKELEFAAFENLQGVSLQLEPITQNDATTAVRRISNSTGLTERDVIRIYNQPGLSDNDGRISMFHLLEYLTAHEAKANS